MASNGQRRINLNVQTRELPSYGSEMRQSAAKKPGGGKLPLIQEVIGQGGNGRNGGGSMPSIQSALRQSKK